MNSIQTHRWAILAIAALGLFSCSETNDGKGSSAPSAPSEQPTPEVTQTQPIDAASATTDSGTTPTDTALPTDSNSAQDVIASDTAKTDSIDGTASNDSPTTECPTGQLCVNSFPYVHEGNTAQLTESKISSYSCKPQSNQNGPEMIYEVTVQSAGFLSAAVYSEDGVDVDVHITSEINGDSCIDRGDTQARADVTAGTWYVIVDTYVSNGVALAGSYVVEMGFVVPTQGSCATETGVMKRVGDGGNHLQMPATGPVVLEAHLVTQEEPAPFPSTAKEELFEHYVLSQFNSGFVMNRTQKWAPLEGGSFYGAGIGPASLLPVLDEHWYVCMYWTSKSRPPRGTRMIMRLPNTNRAVVVAAGHETGPGNLNNIGGTTEETHFYLGSTHKSVLNLGIAKDQSLPLGPITCN